MLDNNMLGVNIGEWELHKLVSLDYVFDHACQADI